MFPRISGRTTEPVGLYLIVASFDRRVKERNINKVDRWRFSCELLYVSPHLRAPESRKEFRGGRQTVEAPGRRRDRCHCVHIGTKFETIIV